MRRFAKTASFPVLFASGGTNVATDHLLDFIKVYAPAPTERAPIPVKTAAMQAVATNGDGCRRPVPASSFRKVDDGQPTALVVFKTMTDPFAGRISFFKVISGVVKNDATLENYTRRGQERFAHLSVMQGRKAVEVAELHAGDMGAVAKLRETLTGDTLGAKGGDIQVELCAAARAGDDLCHRAEEPRRRRQARARDPQADGRRSADSLLPRSADQRIPDCRRGPAAHRGRSCRA